MVSDNICCEIGVTHQRSLSSQTAQHSKREVSLEGHVTNHYLHSPELQIMLSLLQKCKRNMIIHLKDKLQVAANQKGVLPDDADHNDFEELLISESVNIFRQYLKHSFGYLFLEQQMKAGQCKKCLPNALAPSYNQIVPVSQK